MKAWKQTSRRKGINEADAQPDDLTARLRYALISAAILSTTAIFIRYLTQTYQLPALVLAFWRDVFVILTLLLVLRLVARPCCIEPPAPRLSGGLWPRAGNLQRVVDSFGGAERRGGGHRAGVLLGGLYCAAGLVAAQRAPGLDQAAGGGLQPGRLRAGGGRAQSSRLAD